MIFYNPFAEDKDRQLSGDATQEANVEAMFSHCGSTPLSPQSMIVKGRTSKE